MVKRVGIVDREEKRVDTTEGLNVGLGDEGDGSLCWKS